MISVASYRPKSLNELNNSYDKSVASQNVIKDTASAIDFSAFDNTETVKAQTEEFFREESLSSEPALADLSEDISDFIKNFGKPASPDDEVPKPRRVPVKPRPSHFKPVKPVTAAEKEIPQTPSAAVAEPKKQEKPELVITPERSELFDEYMRVMSDEDDDDTDLGSGRHRKKRRGKKAAEQIEESFSEPAAPYEPAPLYESEKETAVEEKPDETESFVKEAVEKEQSFEPDEYTYSTEPETKEKEEDAFDLKADEQEKDEPQKGGILKISLLLLLLLTLISALAVTAVQVVLKVDTGLPLSDKYYFYTVSSTDTLVGINEGDLLVAEKAGVTNGDVFAFYKTADKQFGFAIKTFAEGSEITTGDNSDGPVRLRNTDIYGKVTRIYPSVGSLVSAIKDNFLLVIGAHIVIAAIALILFVFTGKSKKNKNADTDNFTFDEDEDDEETLEEHFSFKSHG